jgi:hypothetical protein
MLFYAFHFLIYFTLIVSENRSKLTKNSSGKARKPKFLINSTVSERLEARSVIGLAKRKKPHSARNKAFSFL